MAEESKRQRKPKVRSRGGRHGNGVRVRASIVRDRCDLSWLRNDGEECIADAAVTEIGDTATADTSDS